MNLQFFKLYQILFPLLVFPLVCYMWWTLYQDWWLVFLIMSIPVMHGYTVPGFGTNVLKLWEFNTRFKMGNYRIHQGFVFGSGTSLMVWFCIWQPTPLSWLETLRVAFITGSVVAMWGWYYDVKALKSGFIQIFNKAAYERKSPEEVGTEYGPLSFGMFGVVYGLAIRVAEHFLFHLKLAYLFWPLFIVLNLIVLVTPFTTWAIVSYLQHGHPGLKSYKHLMKTKAWEDGLPLEDVEAAYNRD